TVWCLAQDQNARFRTKTCPQLLVDEEAFNCGGNIDPTSSFATSNVAKRRSIQGVILRQNGAKWSVPVLSLVRLCRVRWALANPPSASPAESTDGFRRR